MDVEKAKELLTKCKEETGATEGNLNRHLYLMHSIYVPPNYK